MSSPTDQSSASVESFDQMPELEQEDDREADETQGQDHPIDGPIHDGLVGPVVISERVLLVRIC